MIHWISFGLKNRKLASISVPQGQTEIDMQHQQRHVIESMRRSASAAKIWDSARVAQVFADGFVSSSQVRKAQRILDHAHLLPGALLPCEVALASGQSALSGDLKHLIDEARAARWSTFVLQLSEVRKDEWVLMWNNARKARQWIWLDNKVALDHALTLATRTMLESLSKPALLLLHKDANTIRDRISAEIARAELMKGRLLGIAVVVDQLVLKEHSAIG